MTQLGEGVNVGVVTAASVDSDQSKPEKCHHVFLHAFRGDRSPEGVARFLQSLDAAKAGTGPGPSDTDCLLYTGHVGISLDAQQPIYGFNPSTGAKPSWQVMEDLKSKDADRPPYPGKVSDDSAVFAAASAKGLQVIVLELVYPESRFNQIKERFEAEKAGSHLHYSFPGGGGDCNCATWPMKLGLLIPELSGVMKKYIAAMANAETPRKLGICEE